MKTRFFLAAFAILSAVSTGAQAAIVEFIDNRTAGYVDIMYTVNAGAEFTNWDLVATPSVGSILDPVKADKSFNAESGAAPLDTFANTVFSAVGAGAAQYVHTEYNPGQAFPPVAADPDPVVGASAPAPDELNWAIFDTASGDGNIAGFFPYHMARVMYSPGGRGVISAFMFDTAVLGTPETFTTPYGIPEPATFAMAGMGLIGMIGVARRRKA